MRKASGAITAMILAIALYFTLFWGFDALRVLTSPTYGLEDVWRSQFVFGIGAWLHLSPNGLIKLAAFFGALKLTVAGVCGVHVVERLRSLISGKADPDFLEAGLILVVLISLVGVAPALWSNNPDLVREETVQLLLAGLAAALLMVERLSPVVAETAAKPAVAAAAAVTPKATWFAPWRR
jgi:hypothetical protein